MHSHIVSEDRARSFIYGGNAVFTLRSEKTGKHITYRAYKPKGKQVTFVTVRTSPQNEKLHQYIGILTPGGVVHTRSSKVRSDDVSVTAINWLINRLNTKQSTDGVTIFHEGKCCRCARPLTSPDSILKGYGPECAKYMES